MSSKVSLINTNSLDRFSERCGGGVGVGVGVGVGGGVGVGVVGVGGGVVTVVSVTVVVGVPVGIGGCNVREPPIACNIIKDTINTARPIAAIYFIANTITGRRCRGLFKPLN
jgi:hypothetical protein